MSTTNSFSYEQTIVLRRAVDMVLAEIDASSELRRREVARVVLRLANESDYDDPLLLARRAKVDLAMGPPKVSNENNVSGKGM